MGLFFPSDPIVHGQRAKGLPRYQELLERDWKTFPLRRLRDAGPVHPVWSGRGLRPAFFQSAGAAPCLRGGWTAGGPGDLLHDGCTVPQLPGMRPGAGGRTTARA